MMRGLVIATNGDMRVQTFTAPALEDVQKVVGGYFHRQQGQCRGGGWPHPD